MWLLSLALLALSPAIAADPPPAPADAPAELPIVEMPQIAQYVEAPYPPEAQAAHLEGTVTLLIDIDETGTVTHVEVETPAGNGFDEAALAAVLQMKFTPAKTSAGPVPVTFEFAYGFQLKSETPLVNEEHPAEVVPATVNVDGTIHEMGTRRLLSEITVVVVGATDANGADLTTTTGDDGTFQLRGVPVGHWTLRVLSPAHVSLDQPIDVVAGEATTASLWIRANEYRENEAVGVYKQDQQEVTRRTITIDEVRLVPGTFGDPVKVVQTLPGAARSPFGTGLLIIRGSNPEDSAVYVDGVRIPLIYHLTGTTSVLSPDIIEAVDYLPGGYGVQYGRSMGGVVDVRTKEKFEKDKLVWGTDILDSQLYFEGNVGKNKSQGLAIGARRSYIDAFLPLFIHNGFVIKPKYWDYQLKWAPKLEHGQTFSAFVYGFDDTIAAGTPAGTAQGSDADTQGDFFTRYATERLVLHYERKFNDHVTMRVTPSLGVDYGQFNLGNALTLKSWNTLFEIRAEVPIVASPAVEIVPGLDVIGGWWKFDFKSPFQFEDLSDPLAERQAVHFDGHGTAWGPDLYLKANWKPLADRDRLLITPGVRTDLVRFTYKGSVTGTDGGAPPYTITAFDPRIAARFAVIKPFTIKASTGLYNQPPQPQESVGVGTTHPDTRFERALSSSIGVEHQVTPAFEWDVELFYKKMDKLIVLNGAWTGFGENPFVNGGVGKAYGAEVILRHAKTDRFFGWISYTLSKSLRNDCPDDPTCRWYAFDYDQRHIFSAQGGYDLPLDITVSAQVQFVTGNPDSSYSVGVYDVDGDFYNPVPISGYNNERMPSYFQTSVRVERLWTFKKWQASTYVDFMNAIRGVNPEFTTYQYDYSQHAYVRGLPFIPNIGIEAKFWP